MNIKHSCAFARQFFPIIILLFIAPGSKAQNSNIKWGPLNEDKHKIDLDLQYIGKEKNTGNTLWLKKNREGYFFEKFDKTDVKLFSKKINSDSLFQSARKKTVRFYPILSARDQVDILVQFADKNTKLNSVAVLQLSKDGQVIICNSMLFTPDRAAYYKVSVSPDSLQIGIAQIITERKENHVALKTLDRNLNMIDEFNTTLDKPDSEKVTEMGIHDMLIDNSGDFLLDAYLLDKKYDRAGSVYWLLNPKEKLIKRILPDLQGTVVEASEIACNSQGVFEVAGISQQPDLKPQSADNQVLFFGLVDLVHAEIKILRTTTLKMPRFRAEDHGEYYTTNISSSVLRNDGGIILIVEQLMLGRKNLWVHINDVFVANFDPDGSINYFKEVEKKQGYLFGSYISAYSTLPVYDQYSGTLHLIFNINPTTTSRNISKPMKSAKRSMPVIVTIGESGSITKKQLGMPANKSVILCPMWSRQVSNSEVMVGGMEKHGYRIGHLEVNGVKGKYLSTHHQTHYHPGKKIQHHYRKSPREEITVLGVSGGISSPPNAALSNWLNQNGYSTHSNMVNQDLGVFLLSGSEKWAFGFDFSTSQTNLYTADFYPHFAKTRITYFYGRPLKFSSTNKSFLCLGIGLGYNWIGFKDATLPQVSSQPADFRLENMSLVINPSYKLIIPIGKNGFVTGLDIGARICLFPDKWAYDDTKGLITIQGMPSVSTVDFYINVPIMAYTPGGNGRR